MAVEIERKFLVDPGEWRNYRKPDPVYCAQTYILNQEKQNIRVRIMGEKAYLTIKYKLSNISRREYEYEIPVADAKEMMETADVVPIEKNRFIIQSGSDVWEVDVFEGQNKGLIIAEIELVSEGQTFARPIWLGEEVSNDPRYYNAMLQKKPFSSWND